MAYSAEEKERIFNKVIVEMISGRSLRSIMKEDWTPNLTTFLEWVEADEEKAKQYARAFNMRADYLFDEIIDIADDDSGDVKINALGQEVMDGEFVQRSRLRVDARKWVVSKMNPKKYAERLELDNKHSGSVNIISLGSGKKPDESDS